MGPTDSIFTNLAIRMMGFGLLVGVFFPFAVTTLGVDPEIALSPVFFIFSLCAGILVGLVNVLLGRVIVLPRLMLLAKKMEKVALSVIDASKSGDWSSCELDDCTIRIETEDEFAVVARSFNGLLAAIDDNRGIENAVSDFQNALAQDLDLERLSEQAVGAFRSGLGAHAVALVARREGELQMLGSLGILEPDDLLQRDFVERCIRTLQPEHITVPLDLVLDVGLTSLRPREIMVLPLHLHGVGLGAVMIAWTGSTTSTIRLLASMFASSLSVAMSNALAHFDMERLAALDPLTGLYNRRFGLSRLAEEFSRSVRTDHPLGVVMLDIDHFKDVNDTYGHLVGDSVLRKVAEDAKSVLRQADVVVRYGGEEFLILLPGAGLADVELVAERLRRLVAGKVHHAGDNVFSITVSLGYASTSAIRADSDLALVNAADDALYRAKHTGRDRSVAAMGSRLLAAPLPGNQLTPPDPRGPVN